MPKHNDIQPQPIQLPDPGIQIGYMDPISNDNVNAEIDGNPLINKSLELGIWGIVISIIASLFTSAGLCLQKVVHKRINNNPDLAPAYKHSLYLAGVAYVALGLILKTFLDFLLPLSTVAPLSAQTVVYSTFFEYLFLDGELSRISMISLAFIVIGIIVSAIGANIDDGSGYNLHDIWNLFMTETCVVLSGTLLAIIIGLREFFKSPPSSSTTPIFNTLRLVYLSFCSAIFAGWFGTTSKALVELIKYAFLHGMHTSDAKRSGIWIIIAFLPLLGIPKLRHVGYALSEYHHLQFLPLYQSFTIAANVMCGLVYYQDMSTSRIKGTHASLTIFMIGLVSICIGVALLIQKYNPAKHVVASVHTVDETQSLLDWPKAEDEEATMAAYKDEFGNIYFIIISSSSYHNCILPLIIIIIGARDTRTPSKNRIVIKQMHYTSPQQDRYSYGSYDRSPNKPPVGISIDEQRVYRTPSKTNRMTEEEMLRTTTTSPYIPKSGEGTTIKGSHRRVHSGVYESNLREILSPFENEQGRILSNLQQQQGLRSPVQMQALYVGSMSGLNVEGDPSS